MLLTWNAAGDFDEVVDTLESLTLLRRGGASAGEPMKGWRYAQETTDMAGAQGAVKLIDTTWQTPIEAGIDAPQPGDWFRDEDSACSAIQEVRRLRGDTRYVCSTRRVELSPLAAERFLVEKPIYASESEGGAIIGWDTTRPSETAWLHRSALESGQPLALVVFRSEVLLAMGDRLRDGLGHLYRVVTVDGRESIGDPFVAEVEPYVEVAPSA